MKRGWTFLICAAALCAQEPSPSSRKITDLIEEIETTAASEPPVVGIDTQLRLAKLLKGPRPAVAERALREAGARILALADVPTRARLFAAWLDVQRDVNREDAEIAYRTFIAQAPRREREDLDTLSLREFANTTSSHFSPLALDLVRRLPEPGPVDKPTRKHPGASILFDAAKEVKGMDYEQRVSYARKLKDPTTAVTILLDAIDDGGFDGQRKATLATEALDLSAKMVPGDDRMIAQSMLTIRLYGLGDRPRAAVGAQMLADTFEKVYDCETAACTTLQNEDSPGEVIFAFAEYLAEQRIEPGSLGLTHRSLIVRLKLLELQQWTEANKKR